MKKLICTAVLAGAFVLAGCQTPPPPPPPPEPVTVEYEKAVNPVQVREESMDFYGENRGGAALRMGEASHVLWNQHYEVDPELEILRRAARAAEAKRIAEAKKAEADRKALNAKRAKAKAAQKDKQNGKQKAKTDAKATVAKTAAEPKSAPKAEPKPAEKPAAEPAK